MKSILSILAFLGSFICGFGQTDSVFEYQHFIPKSCFGFWTCKKFNDTNLIDLSNSTNNGNIFGCKHEFGRKKRLFFDVNKGANVLDSFGQNRICLNLNGGYVKTGGICFNCNLLDDSLRNKSYTFSFWAKREPNSFGILLDLGNDQSDNNRWIVYNSLNKNNNNDSIHFDLVYKNKVLLSHKLIFPVNDWNLYSIIYDNITNYITISRTVSSAINDEINLVAVLKEDSLNFGYAGSMFLGKLKNVDTSFNYGLSIDDIGFYSEKVPLHLMQDYGLKIKTQTQSKFQVSQMVKNNSLVLYGIPISPKLQYVIYNESGQIIEKGCSIVTNNSLTINTISLKNGFYFIRFSDDLNSIYFSSKFIISE